jgi:hypothetical protein
MHNSTPTTYGIGVDFVDEYYRLGKNTTMECLKRFAQVVVVIFRPVYLREPIQVDIEQL